MLFRLLLSNVGFIVGVVIEAVLTVAAVILIILVLKYGLPKFEPKEREPRQPKPKKTKPAAEQYILKYVAGEGSGESPALEQYAKGAKIILKANMFTTPNGKIFDGWSDGENKYSSKFNYTMPAQAVTLTAQWADIKKDEPQVEVVEQPQPKKEQPKVEPQPQPEVKVEEHTVEQVDGGTTPDGRPIVVNVYAPKSTEKTIEKEIIHTVEKSDDEDEPEEDNMFANYTILELYGLLSDEQKRYFDALKEAALAKPQAKLSAARNFLNIKIGKRSILKLRIRRLITVGEYALENDILKDFRKSSDNKAGNAKIKVRPTLVAVTDDATLQTALSMIDLVHKQILES